jgi:hypothetical protein
VEQKELDWKMFNMVISLIIAIVAFFMLGGALMFFVLENYSPLWAFPITALVFFPSLLSGAYVATRYHESTKTEIVETVEPGDIPPCMWKHNFPNLKRRVVLNEVVYYMNYDEYCEHLMVELCPDAKLTVENKEGDKWQQ